MTRSAPDFPFEVDGIAAYHSAIGVCHLTITCISPDRRAIAGTVTGSRTPITFSLRKNGRYVPVGVPLDSGLALTPRYSDDPTRAYV